MKDHILIYKYNKYQQINGSLFYAFEYLIKMVEESLATNEKIPNDKLPKLLIICPKTIRTDLKYRLFSLFIKKYPLTLPTKMVNPGFNINTMYNDHAKYILSKEEMDRYFYLKNIVSKAFNLLRIGTFLDFQRRNKLNDPIFTFISFNSFYDTLKDGFRPEKFGPATKINVFQNRAEFQIQRELKEIRLPELPITFFYETDYQYISNPKFKEVNQIQEPLKLGLQYFYSEKLFKIKRNNETGILIGGKYQSSKNDILNGNLKPILFGDITSNKFFFDGITKIVYYRNLLAFEENNRLLIEARYYNFKIDIIDITSKNLDHNYLVTNSEIPEYDTSITRLEDDIIKYSLENTDVYKLLEGY